MPFPMMRYLSTKTLSGRVTFATILVAALVAGSALVSYFGVSVPSVSADDVTTSITVLNTPPTWTVDAEESAESSATTPTNAGQVISWVGTGTDSSGDEYFLLICKTSASPTANEDAPPECGGGVSNRWARSATTTSGAQATAATTTTEFFPFDNEDNDWYAWICDANDSIARCNTGFEQGSGSTASPFVVNHPPIFASISNDGPEDPGGTVTWTSTSYDLDTSGSQDTVQLIVCRANDFTGSYCGAGGTWATSTAVTSNAATTTPLNTTQQDATYNAYVFLVDNHGLVATSTVQATNSTFDVNNVAPVVTAASITLIDTDDVGVLELTDAGDITNNFEIEFEVTDANSCLNSSAGDEIDSVIANVYRSGVTQAGCDTAGEFDSNDCYPSASAFTVFSCSQDGGSCSGSSDNASTWTCTFSLWYNADPTDTTTVYEAQNWLASIQATDDDALTSSLTEATSGNELASFLAFDVSSTSIPYGSLEPGQNSPLATSTDLIALGNIGLDQDLYGDTMCTTWSAPDSCDSNGISAADDITVDNQQFATSTVAYDSAGAWSLTSSTSPTTLEVNVPKTTATATPEVGYTFWGIEVPITITTAGNYAGQNTLTAIKSDPSNW